MPCTSTSPRRDPSDRIRRLPDEELIHVMVDRAVPELQNQAWREFQRRFDRLIYRCIVQVTLPFRSIIGREDVEEIHANFLFRLVADDMRRLRAFDPNRGARLSTWLGTLATRAAWDHLRILARQPPRGPLDELEPQPIADADPTAVVAARRRLEDVVQAAESFTDRDQRFMRLYYVDGLSVEQIANRLQISIKTVYSKKHKIRTRLTRAVAQRHAA